MTGSSSVPAVVWAEGHTRFSRRTRSSADSEAGMNTAFTRLVGCTVPLQQAGMGGVAGPDLAAAVAEAGAVGMLGMPAVPAPAVADVLESVRERTSGAVGINFLMPFVDREAV